jgi:dUTP pyrophosphatase
MNEFVCRLCGGTTYYPYNNTNTLFVCGECGTVFSSPWMFSLPDVKFIKIHPDAVAPARAKDGDVGYDVCSIRDVMLYPNCVEMVETGLSVELPPNTEIQVRPRSGLALKYGIMVVNSPGTIDTGYRGPCNILMLKTGNSPYVIHKGDKIAQFIVSPKMPYKFVEVEKLTDTERGEGGFGHTGK